MSKKHPIEKDVKRQVKLLLDKHKWFWWMPAANGFGQSGVSDFLALRGGVFLAIETKTGTAKPTPMQRGFLDSVQAESGFAFVVSETELEYLAAWLEAFDNSIASAVKGTRPSDEDGAILLNCIAKMTRLHR